MRVCGSLLLIKHRQGHARLAFSLEFRKGR